MVTPVPSHSSITMAIIEFFYDFRSPYAYFASHRLCSEEVARRGLGWRWRPISVDVLLNLQAGREPWAGYADPLSAPKRAHLVADVRRLATYFDLPLRAPKPARPNSIPALCLANRVAEQDRPAFSLAVFDALWQEQQDVSAPEVLQDCLARSGVLPGNLRDVSEAEARAGLVDDTTQAYARGVFGVPSFVVGNEVYFGNDRLDLLFWTLERRRGE
jgi:2-hydroxychromene-2-carboxylate isomerase